MAFTRTWNAAYMQLPADTDAASEGANRIRDFKTDIKERVAIDHSMAGDADDGKHLQVTFKDPLGAKPTASASEGYIYTKDVAAKAELFWEDEDGNEVQLTETGYILAFAAGTKMVFYQAAAPTGWTQDTSNTDGALRVVSGSGGGTGGSAGFDGGPTITVAHTLITSQIPAHTHAAYIGANKGYTAGAQSPLLHNDASDGQGATLSTGGGGSHTHAISWAPKYIDVIIATKD